ncbi:MAG: PqqD family protein [Patescibacteria group bacterium]|nr:PqqD family protein [Patescibacteria group bacterium]
MIVFQKGLIIQKLDKKIIIFDSDNSTLFTLNETASLIFDKLKKKCPKEKIIDYLLKKYQVRKERIERDIDEFIEELKKRKIIIEK